MEHFTPASSQRKTCVSPRTVTRSPPPPLLIPYRLPFPEGNLISHIFRKNEVCCEADWEGYFSYSSVEVPNSYRGPRPTFPLTLCGVLKLVEAFKHKQVGPEGQSPACSSGSATPVLLFPAAAPRSLRPAAPWRDVEISENPSKHQPSLRLPK